VKNIIVLVAIIFLCQCKKDPETPYSNENIVLDNAQAALYFHTIFCEAENAWAFIDSLDYKDGKYPLKENRLTIYKELTYDQSTKMATIEYSSWETNFLNLYGTVRVRLEVNSYRREGKVANVFLDDLSINGQRVAGQAAIKFLKKVEDKDKEVEAKDTYSFTLLEGAVIHEYGHSMPVLISCTISNGGQYERITGNKTLGKSDDVWVYSGVMTGMLRNDPNLKYTNTVLTTYEDNKGEKIDGRIYFTNDCITAKKGTSEIKIAKRPNIVFWYNCKECIFGSVTHID